MPTYVYQCPTCGKREEHQKPIADRDDRRPLCVHHNTFPHSATMMRRVPGAPGFTVKGFNAKNGYSK